MDRAGGVLDLHAAVAAAHLEGTPDDLHGAALQRDDPMAEPGVSIGVVARMNQVSQFLARSSIDLLSRAAPHG